MGSRIRHTRIMCVNCNICINKMRRYPALALDSRITAIICTWVSPRIILEDDYICEACRDLAMAAVNISLQDATGSQEAGPSTRGHKNVCLLCGCSIATRQSDKLIKENPTEMQQSIINIIESKIAPQEISASDRVCHACWLRTKREVVRTKKQDKSRPQLDTADDVQEDPNLIKPSEVLAQLVPPPSEIQTIVLPNYRRAPNSTHTCVFPNCSSTTFHNVSDKLRAMILHKHNYYLPKLARVCSEHLRTNMWDSLFNSGIETFTIKQIEHVFSFVNAFSPTLDFESIEDMDDRVFEYCIGLTKEKFNALIGEVPHILEQRRGRLGLAALLLKMRTGDSNERIASLMQVPRRTLESVMKSVREVLCQGILE